MPVEENRGGYTNNRVLLHRHSCGTTRAAAFIASLKKQCSRRPRDRREHQARLATALLQDELRGGRFGHRSRDTHKGHRVSTGLGLSGEQNAR